MGFNVDRPGALPGRRVWCGVCAAGAAALLAIPPCPARDPAKPDPAAAGFHFPTVPADHRHARELLANAMRYADPANKMTDPVSGYPYEGWNQDPDRKLFLRSFTQLTAIGLWLELLANVAAGQADTPYLPRDKALAQLALVAKSLRQDQRDPQLSAKGLLGNFLDLASGRRLGPLTDDVDRATFAKEFGREKGEAIWAALRAKGWIVPEGKGDTASVKRVGKYGSDCFDGELLPYRDEATKRKVMALLDRRTVLVVFGDNANLSASAAKAIGALLLPAVKDRPEAAAVRRELEQFLDGQRDGYAHLYDAKAGLFYFGWDGQKDRWMGWEDPQGKWTTGHMDYLVNEFRDPAAFVVLRHGLPLTAVKNLGFQMKPYRMGDGREVYSLAPWEGSAFQLLGLEVALGELGRPSWRTLLDNAVGVELDYSTRHHLPGLLSESYTGDGTQYTGEVGIPAITVNPKPRRTDVASLYSLGAAYTIAPGKVERFLAANWSVVSELLTDHGPWEGYNVTRREPVRFQTTAHTLSLALGILGNESDNMLRYLDSRDLGGRLAEVYPVGRTADLMAADAKVFAWAAKGGPVQSTRDKAGFRVTGERAGEVGIAFVPAGRDGVSLSGGVLSLRYRSAGPAAPAVLDLKPAGAPVPGVLPKKVFANFADTGGRDEEIRVPLPATPGLTQVKEVVITYGQGAGERAIDFSVTRLEFTPTAAAVSSDGRRGSHSGAGDGP